MPDEEKLIALMADRVLREAAVAVARTDTVLYVEKDTLMRKEPNSTPAAIRKLLGRNPKLANKIKVGGTYKIKKRKIESE